MEITINVKEYLSDDEIKDVCKDALYQKMRDSMRYINVYDIISNISYSEVAKMVDTTIGEKNFCKNEIAKKVPELIENLSVYSIFRKEDIWDSKENIGQQILNEEIKNARPLIKARIEKIINEYDFPMLERNEIMYTIADVLTDRLLPERENAE